MESTPRSYLEKGLIPALRTLARRAAVPVDVTAPDVWMGPHPAIEATAYYIAAEAIANAVKHARAHQVEITLARTPQALQLTISDDGVGGAAVSGGTGLQGLHDRADAVGGHITLGSPGLRGRPSSRPISRSSGRTPTESSLPMPLRLVLADDAALIRQALAELLQRAGVEIVARSAMRHCSCGPSKIPGPT